MSDVDQDDAGGSAAGALPETPRAVQPTPASKTMLGIGLGPPVQKAPPAPAGAAPPPAAAKATLAKPLAKPLAPPPVSMAQAPPSAARPQPAPPPSALGATPQRSTGALAMPAVHAGPATMGAPPAPRPRPAATPAPAPSVAAAPAAVARPKATDAGARGSLFDLDAPSTATSKRTFEAAALTAQPAVVAKASLFDLDAPAMPLASAPAVVMPPLASAAPKVVDPVDALFGGPPPSAAEPEPPAAPRAASGSTGRTTLSDMLGEDSSLDELAELSAFSGRSSTVEFLAKALAPELERPAQTVGPDAPPPAVPEEAFDDSLITSKASDSLDDRKARLIARMKTTRSAFKISGLLDITDDERKEVIGMFGEYEARLKALAEGGPEQPKKDLIALHKALPKEALDELERAIMRIEDRLLVLDEFVPQDKFRARVTKEKHAPKLLLRYARLLACRRFNVGYRRDRFEHLVNELLTVATSDGRWRLLPRDKARPVLMQLLSGQAPSSQDGGREAAVAYLRESLERLAAIATHEEFFESGFFLDVYGYKISMRDQATSPEFLYLSIALNAEIHNRVESWIAGLERLHKANQLTQDGPPREYLLSQLRSQEEAVQSVFGSFRHPKDKAQAQAQAQQANARALAQETKETKQEVRKAPKKKKKEEKQISGAESLQQLAKQQMIRFAVLSTLIAASFGYVLTSTGILSFAADDNGGMIAPAQVHDLSPLIEFAFRMDNGKWLRGTVKDPQWRALDTTQRRGAAERFAKKLAQAGIPNAELMVYKTAAIRIDLGVISYVEPASPK